MERPTKRPRPDGFEKPKPTYKPPKCINTFASGPNVSATKPTPNNSSKPVSKTSHVTQLPRNPFSGCITLEENKPRVPKKQLKPVSLAYLPLVLGNDDEERQVTLKPLKPPVLAHAVHDEGKSFEKASTSIMSLQHMIKPPSTTSEKPKSIRKPPPMPALFPSKPTAPLKPPLPPVQQPASPQKTMKTILTTSVAQAIDPTKEGTGAELLALFLQQHGHDFTSSADQELHRGIMLSPDKRSRGKHPKFIRGGLAERAQQHISCDQTDFVLWRCQTEKKAESAMRATSDIRLHILRILHVLKIPEKPHSVPVPRCALAVCRVMGRHKFVEGDLTAGTYLVLFNFTLTYGSGPAISSAQQFGEGRDVFVWMPWQEINVSAGGNAEIQRVFLPFDDLIPPHTLLVVSRFYVSAPKQPD